MSDPVSTISPPEATFRSYSQKQAKSYAQHRSDYSPHLYQLILDYHQNSFYPGQCRVVLDVGCGPGRALSSLAPSFTRAIGLDASEGMILHARSLHQSCPSTEFHVSTAEQLGSNLSPPMADASVDVMTAATAAHWFDLSVFWARAARVMRPGGTVALFTSGLASAHPDNPNAARVQDALDRFLDSLQDYMSPGNKLAHDLYMDLTMPWQLPEPVEAFDAVTLVRREWNTPCTSETQPFSTAEDGPVTMDMFEQIWATASAVTRWRAAHPHRVDEQDIVRMLRREMEALLRDETTHDGIMFRPRTPAVLLLLKKKI